MACALGLVEPRRMLRLAPGRLATSQSILVRGGDVVSVRTDLTSRMVQGLTSILMEVRRCEGV